MKRERGWIQIQIGPEQGTQSNLILSNSIQLGQMFSSEGNSVRYKIVSLSKTVQYLSWYKSL